MQSIRQYRRLRANLESQNKSRSRAVEQDPDDAKGAGIERKDYGDNESQQDRRNTPPASAFPSRQQLSTETLHDPHSSQDCNMEKQNDSDSDSDTYRVDFDSDEDPLNPKNWPFGKKWRTMGIVATTGFIVGWASSIDSAVLKQAEETFEVSSVVEALAGTGIFLIAFGVGSLVAGPFSETVGRNPVYIVSLVLFMIFTMASGLAPNIGAQIAFRFLAGLFACTPLTTFGGSMSDMFRPLDRTYVFPVCACLSFLGPFLAPMVGSFIGASTLVSWRWTEWTTLIITGLITLLIFFFVPETYAPILLKWKAEHLRQITNDDRYRADVETQQSGLLSKLLQNATRPLQMFVSEIMVTLFTIYLVVVYIILFGFLVGYDFIFGDVYQFDQGSVGLTFIGMNVGFLVALAIVPFIYRGYARKLRKAESKGSEIEPEQRLWYAMLGAPFLPISLFWMAWTTYPSISYWSPLVASVFFGFSVQGIFIATYQYLIDTYEAYAASALVTATLFRYVAAGAMQVVSLPMYENLGVHWTLTLLGCIGVIMTPVPYIFYFFGPSIRQKFSKKAQGEDEEK